MLQDKPMFAYIPVASLDRARQFYEQTLGFTPARTDAGGVTYAFADGTAAFMYPSAGAGTNKASQAFWEVADVEREVAELKSRGVQFEEYDMPGLQTKDGIMYADGAQAAWFKDSEGNIMAIIKRPSGA